MPEGALESARASSTFARMYAKTSNSCSPMTSEFRSREGTGQGACRRRPSSTSGTTRARTVTRLPPNVIRGEAGSGMRRSRQPGPCFHRSISGRDPLGSRSSATRLPAAFGLRGLVAKLQAVVVKGIADPGVSDPVGSKADIVLNPHAPILERKHLAQPRGQIPSKRIDAPSLLDVLHDDRQVRPGRENRG